MLSPSRALEVPGVSDVLSSLDDRHRDVLAVLALDDDARGSRTSWNARANDAGLVDDRGRKLSNEYFRTIAAHLASIGAVTRDQRGDYRIMDAWLAPILEDAHRRQRLARIARDLSTYGHRFYTPRAIGGRGNLLVALASDDRAAVGRAETLFKYYRSGPSGAAEHPLVGILGLHAPFAWIACIDPALRIAYLRDALDLAFVEASSVGAGLVEAACASEDEQVRAQGVMLLALMGDAPSARERARATLEKAGTSQWMRGARAFFALTEGKLDEAREGFRVAAVGSRGQRVDLPGTLAVFDTLLAATSDRADEVADVLRRIHKGRRHFARFSMATFMLEHLAMFRTTGTKTVHRVPNAWWIDDLVVGLGQRWMGIDDARVIDLREAAVHARANGYAWLAAETERISEGTLVALFGNGNKEGWELVLDSLRAAVAPQSSSSNDGATTSAKKRRGKSADAELWWTVTVHPESRWVDVDACVATSLGVKGTKIAYRRVLEEPGVPIRDQDRRIAERLIMMRELGDYLLPGSALLEMVGHPRVRDSLGRHVAVEASEPKLRVDPTTKGARIVLVPSTFDHSGTAVEREGDRFVVYSRTPVIARIAAALPPNGVDVPRAALGRMNELLATIGGSVGVETSERLASATAEADPRLHIQLFRTPGGMRARIRVVPAASGPALRPGAPPAETVVTRDGELVRITRDLAAERMRLDALLERCPTLASLPRDGDDLVARELETCLELLVELREAETDAVIEWLEGQPLRAPSLGSGSQVRLRVKGDSTWLSVDGEVHVDEERVLGMREVLEAASRARGRFVPIGADEWLALTDDLRKKLEALGRVVDLGKDGRVSTALLSSMDGIFEGFDVSFEEAIAKKRDALARAIDLDVRVPRNLQTELRDYQRDGFLFLARRTEAGLGACLADDMGLGKTVQALALLLHRRKRGPALVVAPTSVCRNWEDEAMRFAPSLSVRRLGDGSREDRTKVVTDAKAGDLVITSYGLLAAEEALLAGRRWGTVVFDEAHALKNASTRRWSAANALEADAFVALSGTPVENHAGELHALLDLLVPGMLGSRSAFDRTLGAAIADGSRDAAALLRRLVRPFVLRRTKTQVLSELPPKTEVVQVIQASEEHLAFYEAVRRRAVEKIEAAKRAGGAKAGRARIDLLAEIMRLRRAAIDPRLVGGETAPEGAKLDALAALVAELRAEGRRALVFSQFLEVLDFARARLEAEGVECVRLDGTMPEATRAAAVSAFQSGRGDVFLVSLKAGGVGMNLTAADVVILLDPWWNPAVEDQAAGRAHRIGQTRPVTVVRIVTERTIEEKVLALHAKKRQLFDDVVADADGTGTLDIETISALLGDDGAGASRKRASSDAAAARPG